MDDTALRDTHAREVTSALGFHFLLSLFSCALLRLHLAQSDRLTRRLGVLFGSHWNELHRLVGVRPSAVGTQIISMMFNVVPAETTDLDHSLENLT